MRMLEGGFPNKPHKEELGKVIPGKFSTPEERAAKEKAAQKKQTAPTPKAPQKITIPITEKGDSQIAKKKPLTGEQVKKATTEGFAKIAKGNAKMFGTVEAAQPTDEEVSEMLGRGKAPSEQKNRKEAEIDQIGLAAVEKELGLAPTPSSDPTAEVEVRELIRTAKEKARDDKTEGDEVTAEQVPAKTPTLRAKEAIRKASKINRPNTTPKPEADPNDVETWDKAKLLRVGHLIIERSQGKFNGRVIDPDSEEGMVSRLTREETNTWGKEIENELKTRKIDEMRNDPAFNPPPEFIERRPDPADYNQNPNGIGANRPFPKQAPAPKAPAQAAPVAPATPTVPTPTNPSPTRGPVRRPKANVLEKAKHIVREVGSFMWEKTRNGPIGDLVGMLRRAEIRMRNAMPLKEFERLEEKMYQKAKDADFVVKGYDKQIVDLTAELEKLEKAKEKLEGKGLMTSKGDKQYREDREKINREIEQTKYRRDIAHGQYNKYSGLKDIMSERLATRANSLASKMLERSAPFKVALDRLHNERAQFTTELTKFVEEKNAFEVELQNLQTEQKNISRFSFMRYSLNSQIADIRSELKKTNSNIAEYTAKRSLHDERIKPIQERFDIWTAEANKYTRKTQRDRATADRGPVQKI